MYNIAYITDENYVLPTKVSLTSLIEAVQGEEVLVTIVTDEVSPASRQSLLDMRTSNVHIRLVEGDSSLKSINVEHPRITKAALNKFYLGDFVPDADKLLFLDGDTLLFRGFLSIFDTEISNAYAAVVPDMFAMRYLNCHNELGLDFYYNTGVMLLNLNKIREDGLAEKFVNDMMRRSNARFMEQDTINVVFDCHVVKLGLAFNCMDAYIANYSESEILEFYGARKEELSSPFIRHLAGTTKPWEQPGPYKLVEWLSGLDNGDYLNLSKKYFEVLAKEVGDRAVKYEGMVSKPYPFGLDMLRSSTDGVKLEGFYPEEKWGRWCRSKASIQVSGEDFLKLSGSIRLCFKVRAFHIQRRVKLFFNGILLGEFTAPCSHSRVMDVAIAQDKMRDSNLIEFEPEGEPLSQKDLGLSLDTRYLSIGFGFIRITETMKARLASSESRLASSESRLASLGKRLTSSEARFAASESSIASLEKRLTSSEARLAASEARLADLAKETKEQAAVLVETRKALEDTRQNLSTMAKGQEDQGAMIVEIRRSLDEAHTGLRAALAEIEAMRNSAWFKFGRALTFVPRKLRAIFAKLLGAS